MSITSATDKKNIYLIYIYIDTLAAYHFYLCIILFTVKILKLLRYNITEVLQVNN